MTFYTSYYANLKNIPKDYITVSISGDIPDYIKEQVDVWDRRFAPNRSLFKEYKEAPEGLERELLYIKRFKNEVLSIADINEIIKSWDTEIKSNKKFVILCYESNNIEDSTFCHRRIVAEAISEKYGIEVPELFFDYENYEIKDYKVKVKTNFNEEEW